MLLRQKPMCSKFYIAVKDAEINDYLQTVGFIPKYYDNYIYYYTHIDKKSFTSCLHFLSFSFTFPYEGCLK